MESHSTCLLEALSGLSSGRSEQQSVHVMPLLVPDLKCKMTLGTLAPGLMMLVKMRPYCPIYIVCRHVASTFSFAMMSDWKITGFCSIFSPPNACLLLCFRFMMHHSVPGTQMGLLPPMYPFCTPPLEFDLGPQLTPPHPHKGDFST